MLRVRTQRASLRELNNRLSAVQAERKAAEIQRHVQEGRIEAGHIWGAVGRAELEAAREKRKEAFEYESVGTVLVHKDGELTRGYENQKEENEDESATEGKQG